MTPIKWFYGFLKKYQKLMIGGLFLTTVKIGRASCRERV